MVARVERTDLPGIGIRHDVLSGSGRRISVITYRDGGHEVAISDAADPDRAAATVRLEDDEAAALAQLLGGSLILTQIAGVSESAARLAVEEIVLPAESPFAGRPLGETRARTRTRCSIVALVRGDGIVSAPGPEATLEPGDTLVAVGTRDGLKQLTDILVLG